jgi:hypothetical protein
VQLRSVGLSGEVAATNNLVLKRDAGTFTFRSGNLYFLAPVNGKITGAVFVGEGTFTLAPPLEMEKKSLRLLTQEDNMLEEFNEAVLRFTDGTYEEIKKAAGVSPGAPAGSAAGLLSDNQKTLRKRLHWNLTARILQDVLSSEPGGFFAAFIKGKKYNGKVLFVVDPHGAPDVAPEEVSFSTYDENKLGIWAAFHASSEYAAGTATGTQKNATINVEQQKLDTQIEKSGRLSGNATTTFLAQANGVRVVPLNLFPTLRVESVSDASGHALAFIQEAKEDDPDFAVILPQALAAGERYTLKTVYSGKDAVSNEGNGNYFPVARETWYPNTSFGDYAEYEMRFRVPKDLSVVASGALLHEVTEGNQQISEWKSEAPQAVGGFNIGQFKRLEDPLPGGFLVTSYANELSPDSWRGIDTRPLMKKPLAEAHLAVQLYTDYFGATPYKHLAMTQQTACNFGQAWPELVYLPICSYLDTTERHFMGLDDTRGYWKVVAPHEVAHQWWGHTVGFNSYRDQWMSEGFAEFSASLFVLQTYGIKEFRKFWEDEHDLLTEKNPEGYRAIDVGPVTQGYRLASSKAGFDIPRHLIYPKGAYILHMIRMMMWDSQNRDHDNRFKSLMQDLTKTHANQAISTEDFKAMVEKHMTRGMDFDGNGRMDWFFDDYVYGTALPTYKLEYSLEKAPDGSPVLNLKITQSGVSPQFRMLVPVYLLFTEGRFVQLGSMRIAGNTTVQDKVPLASLKEMPARVAINYLEDVLCTSEAK